MTTIRNDYETSSFTSARRRQEKMLEEVRRRLSDIAAEMRHSQDETIRIEQEACALEVHAMMPTNEGAVAEAATRQRKEELVRLAALEERRAQLYAREQRLLGLEHDLKERIRMVGELADILAASSSEEPVSILVDRALARSEGSEREDDEYEAEF